MYKIYTAKITRFGPPILVIVSAYQNTGGYYKAESFIIFPEPHAAQSFNELKFNEQTFSDSPIQLDEEFMLEEALSQAEIDIGLHIEQNYSKNPLLVTEPGIEFKDENVRLLAHLRVREVANYLWDIKDHTQCETLSTELEKVMALPSIKRKKL